MGKLRCHIGEEDVCTSNHPLISTEPTRPPTPSTPTPSLCHKEGPTAAENCKEDFICCSWDDGWVETNCTCQFENVFSLDFELCTNEDMCYIQDAEHPWEL